MLILKDLVRSQFVNLLLKCSFSLIDVIEPTFPGIVGSL